MELSALLYIDENNLIEMNNILKYRDQIAERFYHTIEAIIKSDLAKNYRDVERQTGINHQRINAIKSFVLNDGKPNYPQLEYIYLLHSVFNVSVNYLILGEGEIFNRKKENEDKEKNLEFTNKRDSDPKPESILDTMKQIKLDVEYIRKFF